MHILMAIISHVEKMQLRKPIPNFASYPARPRGQSSLCQDVLPPGRNYNEHDQEGEEKLDCQRILEIKHPEFIQACNGIHESPLQSPRTWRSSNVADFYTNAGKYYMSIHVKNKIKQTCGSLRPACRSSMLLVG